MLIELQYILFLHIYARSGIKHKRQNDVSLLKMLNKLNKESESKLLLSRDCVTRNVVFATPLIRPLKQGWEAEY